MDEHGNLTAWGALQPRGVDRLILLAAKAGLGRGKLKRLINRLWQARNERKAVDIDYHGIKLRLHPWDNTIEAKILFSSRLREGEELQQIKQNVGKGAFVDIGANVGYYSLMACKQGYEQVLAFEPNPLMYGRMQYNFSVNAVDRKVSSFQVALGDRDGNVELVIAPTGDMGGTHVADVAPAGPAQETVSVPMKALYEVLSEHGVSSIGAMKIDVEGFEDSVLFPFFDHAPRALWPKLIVIEHTSQKSWSRDILSWMLDNGYSVSAQNKGNTILVVGSS